MLDWPALSPATTDAAAAVCAGDLDAARSSLESVLTELESVLTDDVPTAGDGPINVDLCDAACLYAGVLAAGGYPQAAVGYSTYAYESVGADGSVDSDRRLRAAVTHAHVLFATGEPGAAVIVARDLVRLLIARFGATDRRTLAAHADLAVAFYAAGDCLTARQVLHRTGEFVRETYGPDDPLSARMLDRLTSLTRACSAAIVDGRATVDGAPIDGFAAGHVCGRPDRSATESAADLFLDLFTFVGKRDVDASVASESDPMGIDAADTGLSGADADHADAVGVSRSECGANEASSPYWADRPTAGYPAVPTAAGVHPTWVLTSPGPLGAAHPVAERSIVATAESIDVDLPAAHSRATFGRMRRRLSQSGAGNRPQRTATTSSSARITDGE